MAVRLAVVACNSRTRPPIVCPEAGAAEAGLRTVLDWSKILFASPSPRNLKHNLLQLTTVRNKTLLLLN